MDAIKGWIASEVQASVKMFERRGIPQEGAETTTVQRLGDLQTRIRVQTAAGPRYFDVIVKEVF